MSYEQTKREAAETVDKWFCDNKDLFLKKAKTILERYNAYEKEQSLTNPILSCLGKVTEKENWIGFTLGEFLNENEALLVYYSALIILHDTAEQGYVSIAGNIWPRKDGGLRALAQHAFNPYYGDKTYFIATALRRVQADLNTRNRKKTIAASGGTADLPNEKTAETGQKGASSPMHIQNSNVILVDVNQPGNLQVGDHTQIQEQTVTDDKKNGSFKKLLKIIAAFVGFLAALLAIFHYLGWLEPIKHLFTK